MVIRSLALLFVALAAVSDIALAQSSDQLSPSGPSSTEFFDRDFVTQGSPKAQATTGHTSNPAESGGTPQQQAQDIFSDKSGKKIVALGIIINQQPWDTALLTLGTLRDLIAQFEINGGEVQIIGNETEMGPKEFVTLRTRLAMLGAKVSVVREPQKPYQVSQSPTWIVYTSEGRYLLEGLINPRRQMNSRGEFIEP